MSNKLTYKNKYKGGGILHLDAGGHIFGGWSPHEIDTESSNRHGYSGGNRIVDDRLESDFI